MRGLKQPPSQPPGVVGCWGALIRRHNPHPLWGCGVVPAPLGRCWLKGAVPAELRHYGRSALNGAGREHAAVASRAVDATHKAAVGIPALVNTPRGLNSAPLVRCLPRAVCIADEAPAAGAHAHAFWCFSLSFLLPLLYFLSFLFSFLSLSMCTAVCGHFVVPHGLLPWAITMFCAQMLQRQ